MLLPLYLGLVLLSVLVPTRLLAQNSLGVVEGSVTDAKGGLVAGALVKVLNRDTGVAIQTKTNSDGFYSVPALVPGDNYTVSIAKTGFEELEITGVAVQSSNTSTVAGVLKVGEVSTSVTVTSEGGMLNKDSAAVTTNMDEQLVDNLPYPEQGSLEVALLAPGVRGSQTDPSGLGTENPNLFIAAVEPGAQIAINGAPAGHSAILVDGADVTQSSYARAGITVSSGMAGQVTVVSNGVPAQYGRTMGGVVITSTKSGTNEYHGRVQWRHTDPLLQAQGDGLPLRPALHQNFFGAFLGGPVVIPHIYDGHNKTFFFAGFEPARFSNSTGMYGNLPIPAELNGQFNDDINLLNPAIVAKGGTYQAAQAAPRLYSINYPSATNAQGFPVGPTYSSISGSARNYIPIVNNDVSAQLALNPFAQFMVAHLPTLSNPQETIFNRTDGYYESCICAANGTNAFLVRTVQNVDNRWAVRLDHTISSADRMYLRFSDTPLTAQRTGTVVASNPLDPWPSDSSMATNILIDETHVFNSSFLNEFKVSYLRNKQNRQEPASALEKDWAGSNGLLPSAAGVGFPALNLGLGYGFGTTQIALNTDTTSLLQDDFTIVKGRHKVMFGIDLRRLQSNQDSNPGYYGGSYSFNAGSTQGYAVGSSSGTTGGGVGLASLDLGLIANFSAQTASVPAHYRWQYYGAYVQDDFRVLPKLTLNIGIRYEVETPRKEINDLQGTFIPSITGAANGQAATGGFCFSGACGLPHTIFPMNYRGVQPRIGIAWAPLNRLTVRGSFAILRVPLTGLSNTPVPNFGVAANSIGGTTGGLINNQPVDYITNPIAASTVSALTLLQGSRGPYFVLPSNLAIPYIRQVNTVPYSQSWSFTLQYQLLRKTLVETGYNGSHNIHLFNNNQNPQNIPNMSTVIADINAGANFSCSSVTATANCPGIKSDPYQSNNFSLLQSLLPYSGFYNQSGQINEIYNRQGTSSYNAMYVSVSHHFDRGLSLQGSFTWSKSLDNNGADSANLNAGSGFAAALQTPFNRAAEKAVSDFDVPARTIIGYTYRLPYGNSATYKLPTDGRFGLVNGVINGILGDWSTGGIDRMESSTPFLPTLGHNSTTGGAVGYWFSTGNGNPLCVATPTPGNCVQSTVLPVGINPRPDVVQGVPCINSLWKSAGVLKFGESYINPQAFTVPGTTTLPGTTQPGVGENFPAYGNAPRTMANCRSPRQINFDMNLSKIVPIKGHEKMNVMFTITATNVFNHPLYFFNGAGTNSTTGNNGQIFTTYATVPNDPNCVATSTTYCPSKALTSALRSGVDNPNYQFQLPPGFTVSNQFGTVNPGFTAQFSRIVQVGASFNF